MKKSIADGWRTSWYFVGIDWVSAEREYDVENQIALIILGYHWWCVPKPATDIFYEKVSCRVRNLRTLVKCYLKKK